jgi:hypothetical protein
MRLFSPLASLPSSSSHVSLSVPASDHAHSKSCNGARNSDASASASVSAGSSASVDSSSSANAINSRASDRADIRAFHLALELARCVPPSVRDRALVLAFAEKLRRSVCGLDAAEDAKGTHRDVSVTARQVMGNSSAGAVQSSVSASVSASTSGSGPAAVSKLPQFDMAAAIAMAGFVPKAMLDREPVVLYRCVTMNSLGS